MTNPISQNSASTSQTPKEQTALSIHDKGRKWTYRQIMEEAWQDRKIREKLMALSCSTAIGVSSALFTVPIDKVWMHCVIHNNSLTIQAAMKSLDKPYKGLGIATTQAIYINLLLFGLKPFVKDQVRKCMDDEENASLLSLGITGAISTAANGPCSVVKQMVYTKTAKSALSACKKVAAEKGWRGFFVGTPIISISSAFFWPSSFMLGKKIRQILPQDCQHTSHMAKLGKNSIAGALAGIALLPITTPLFAISAHQVHNTKSSAWKSFVQIASKSGASGFYRGATSIIPRVGITTGLAFGMHQLFEKLFDVQM